MREAPRRLLGAGDFLTRAGRVDRPTAAISIDVESDYNSQQYEALGRLGDMIATIQELDVPLTAFVEGQFFANRRHVPEQLAAARVDVQLHCFDHLKAGDDPADLRRGVAAYESLMGRRPIGYRAHTYRLTTELARALMDEGFRWDSSVLPAAAHGGNRGAGLVGGDYYVLDDRLVEFPLSTWSRLPVPLIHSYRLLMKPPVEVLFRAALGYPRLVVYDMHMADLVWSRSLAGSPLPAHVKLLYRYMWGLNRRDTFGSLRAFVADLRRRGYELVTLSQLHERVTAS